MIDTSIYNNLLRPPKSVAELDAEAMAGQQNRLALRSTQMQMADRERGLAEDAQMRGVVAGFGADKTANYNALLKTGNIKAAQGYEKQNADTAKVQREAEKKAFAVAKQKLELINNAIAGSKDPQSYAMNRQMLAQNGIDISQIPEQFDPAYIANAGQQAMTEIQRVDQAWKAKGFDLETQKFGETVRNNKEQTSVQMRGQNMTANTAAAGRAQSAKQHGDRMAVDKGDTGPSGAKGGKAPAGYRWTAGGDLEPIPGGPAGNKSTSSEGERKAGTLLQRLEFSEKQLEAAVKRKPGAAKPDLIANGLRGMGMEAAANTITGSDRQEVDAAQLDLLDAALTLGTGAAYTKQQLEAYQKSYFAQIGDTPANVKAKEARLKNVIDAARTQAGRSAPAPKAPTNAQAGPYDDAEKERRYQEWKAKQGQK